MWVIRGVVGTALCVCLSSCATDYLPAGTNREASSAAVATPETAEPVRTVRPTLRPTPTPDPRLAPVIDHFQASNETLGQLLRELLDSLAQMDTGAIVVHGRALSDFALSELRWNGEEDIPECLAPLFREWSDALILASGVGVLFEVGAQRSDARSIELGTEQLSQLNESLREVIDELRSAQSTC